MVMFQQQQVHPSLSAKKSKSSRRPCRRSSSIFVVLGAICTALTVMEVFQSLRLLETMKTTTAAIVPRGSSSRMFPSGIHHDENETYVPAATEAYVVDHSVELGLDSSRAVNPSGCRLWQQKLQQQQKYNNYDNSDYDAAAVVPDEIRAKFERHLQELKVYNDLVDARPVLKQDLRLLLRGEESSDERDIDDSSSSSLPRNTTNRSRYSICDAVDMPLDRIFSDLSRVSPRAGVVEPLLPPLRHPLICGNVVRDVENAVQRRYRYRSNYILDLSYLVHDFGAICRQLKPHSRTVFIDMGASLSFHGNHHTGPPPPEVYLTDLYRKFGLNFDHIYAYELVPQNTRAVFEDLVPEHMMAAYHWINVGVDSRPGAKLNPFTMLKKNFLPDDFVVVKLDVDNTNTELPLATQLLHDEQLHSLVDHFYFEHHVHLDELAMGWLTTMHGTIHESLQLFYQLRQKGIAAHYWV